MHALNLHYTYKPDTAGQNLSTDLDYLSYHNPKRAGFKSKTRLPDGKVIRFGPKAKNHNEQRIRNYSAKLDMTYPTKWAKWSYGLKANFTQSDNDMAFFDVTLGEPLPDPNQIDHFSYSENTQALYLSASSKLGSQWRAKLGLRVENTQTKGVSQARGETHKNTYTQWFPTFYLSYNPSANQGFSLSYGKRIDRPTYRMLNPYRWYFSALSYTTGNPALKPAFTDNFKLSHSWKSILTSALNFYEIHDGIDQTWHVNPENGAQIFRVANSYTADVWGLHESLNLHPYPWWQSQEALQINHSQFKFDRKKLNTADQRGTFVYVSTNNTFMLNRAHTLQGDLNFWYNSREQDIAELVEPRNELDIGIKALLFDKNLEIALNAYDLLKAKEVYSSGRVDDIESRSINYHDNRYARLSVKWRIGSKRVKVKRWDFGNKTERERA